MFHARTRFAPMICLSLATIALAQPCTPHWDGTAGSSGITSGYCGAFGVYDSGSGENLYAGGSFASLGTGAYLSRWNRTTNAWSALGSGINPGNTNAFITSMAVFNTGLRNELIVGGFFASAGSITGTKSLAKWNGTAWTALGSNFTPNTAQSVWSMLAWNGLGGNRLYIGGAFPAVAGIPSVGIASWDGATWTSLATSMPSISANPVVFALAGFDDGQGPALFAAGRFDSIDGVVSPLIAKWNGEAWLTVGGGLSPTSAFSDVEALAVFNDGTGPALYAGGWTFTPPGQGACSVAKWNGTQWRSVGGTGANLGGRTTSLAVFDDGNGPHLYAGGTAQPGINYLARLDGNTWVILAGGVAGSVGGNFPSVFALKTWGDRLYVGGDFTTAGAGAGLVNARGIVARTSCPRCVADFDDGSGTGHPDGGVTLDDLLYYLVLYGGGDVRADVDDGSGTGTRDGGVTLDDLLFFLSHYQTGC